MNRQKNQQKQRQANNNNNNKHIRDVARRRRRRRATSSRPPPRRRSSRPPIDRFPLHPSSSLARPVVVVVVVVVAVVVVARARSKSHHPRGHARTFRRNDSFASAAHCRSASTTPRCRVSAWTCWGFEGIRLTVHDSRNESMWFQPPLKESGSKRNQSRARSIAIRAIRCFPHPPVDEAVWMI